jgi:hypothetical protein
LSRAKITGFLFEQLSAFPDMTTLKMRAMEIVRVDIAASPLIIRSANHLHKAISVSKGLHPFRKSKQNSTISDCSPDIEKCHQLTAVRSTLSDDPAFGLVSVSIRRFREAGNFPVLNRQNQLFGESSKYCLQHPAHREEAFARHA